MYFYQEPLTFRWDNCIHFKDSCFVKPVFILCFGIICRKKKDIGAVEVVIAELECADMLENMLLHM